MAAGVAPGSQAPGLGPEEWRLWGCTAPWPGNLCAGLPCLLCGAPPLLQRRANEAEAAGMAAAPGTT